MAGSTANQDTHPRQAFVELRCKACGGWISSAPSGTSWLRGRCGNRSALGQPGRKCAEYGQTQQVRFPR
jgi:hypothetical protein